MAWNEDRIHRALRRHAPRGLLGSALHDAAVLRAGLRHPVLCVDQVVEGVHVLAGAPARAIGRKAAARALSDLAATAARPVALLCTLAVPAARTEAWVLALIDGVRREARRHGAELVGGDLSATSGPFVVGVSALGDFELAGRPPGRDRARAGQRVVVTGALGGSLLGRHLRIEPRLDAGRALARAGATALMDVSDGLAWDLFRLARAAGVAIELELERVPLHRDARRRARTSGRTPLDHALHDGEDHELLATLPARAPLPRGVVELGRVVRGAGLVLVDARGRRRRWTARAGGWQHGGGQHGG